jgi:hypothetical protein
MTRRAACSCGELQLVCEGEPVRISMCHCLECQRRTGAVFGNQAWFSRQQVISVSGVSAQFKRVADSGNTVTFQFCPVCGSTVYWEAQGFPGLIAVAVGSFADPAFPAPAHSVCEWRRHHWVKAAFDMPVEHSNDDDARPRGGLALGLDCV